MYNRLKRILNHICFFAALECLYDNIMSKSVIESKQWNIRRLMSGKIDISIIN